MDKTFTIVITKQVVFRDQTGRVTHTLEVGSKLKATADTGHYYVTSLGGIYHDEAEIAQ